MKKVDNLQVIMQLVESAEKNLATAKHLLGLLAGSSATPQAQAQALHEKVQYLSIEEGGKVLEGVFDGQNMVGPEKKIYPVPANYASKSKLVVGDVLRLLISEDGSFVYKQVRPVERKRLIGTLIRNAKGEYSVQAEDKVYRVLLAALTYYKATEGDRVTIIIPAEGPAVWAAVENVIKHQIDDIPESDERILSTSDALISKPKINFDIDEEL